MIIHEFEMRGVLYLPPVKLDFDAIKPGLVPIFGPTGAGKSTLLEATGPAILFREFPSRTRRRAGISKMVPPGQAASIRLAFDLAGEPYEAVVQVSKAGTETATLTGGIVATSGKVSDYDAAVADLLGSREVFYSSVFGTTENDWSLVRIDRRERRLVFRHYLGLDRLEAASGIAKKRADHVARLAESQDQDRQEAVRLKGEIVELAERHAGLKPKIERLCASLVRARAELSKAEGQAGTEIRKRLAARRRDLATSAETLRAVKLALADRQKALAAIPAETGDLSLEIAKAKKDLASAQSAETKLRFLSAKRDKAADDLDRAEADQANLKTVPCGGAGRFGECRFIRDAAGAADRAVAASDSVEAAKVEIAKIVPAASRCRALAESVDAATRKQIRSAREQERRTNLVDEIERIQKTVEAGEKSHRAVASDVTTLERQVAALPTVDLDGLHEKVDLLEGSTQEAIRQESRLGGQIEEVRRQRKSILSRLSSPEAKTAKARLGPLRWLAEALGPKGVQALEIANSCPAISDLATEIIRPFDDGRMRLIISTIRNDKDDLSIEVADRLRQVAGTFDDVSKGEKVLIDYAIRWALNLYWRQSQAGPEYRTIWQDEMTDALDPIRSSAFLGMLEQVCRRGQIRHALHVTHDTRIIDSSSGSKIHISQEGRVEVL